MKFKKILYKNSLGFTFLKFSLVINIINTCNRACSFCPYHSPKLADNYHTNWMKQQPDRLEYMDFEKFIKRIGVFRKLLRNVAITGKGEPFLHTDLCKFCDLLEKYKIPFSVTTNGDNPLGIIHILSSYKHITNIRVSLYDKRTIELYEGFKKHPKLTYFNMAGGKIKGIEDGYISAQYGIKHKRAIKDFNKSDYCIAPFSFLTLNTDGSIVPCYSYDEVSNINRSFWDIWNGKKVREYRKQAVNGRNLKYADCDNCGINIK